VTVHPRGCNMPLSRRVPSLPWSPCALAKMQEGSWYGDSNPTGYKLMWRVPHSEEGSTLD
jgi:hypothetical protein